MSYAISLEVDAGGPERVRIAGSEWRCTSNLVWMCRAAGVDLAGFHGLDAGGCAAGLEVAIATLKADPERFRAMNPPNGWGSYDGLVQDLEVLFAIFSGAPRAIVDVYR